MPRKGNMKPESRDRWKENEEGHLHRLELILGDGGKGDAHREVRGDEDERDDEKQKNAALHRDVKKKISGDKNDRDLDVTDQM